LSVVYSIAALVALAVIIAIPLFFRWGKKTRCPVCQRRWARLVTKKELVRGEVIKTEERTRVRDFDYSYVPVRIYRESYRIHMKCRYCNAEWVRGETKEK
jgi:hypothetical protein